jgi:copper(I)-binding protein
VNPRLLLLTLIGLLSLSACANQPAIQVSDPWVRAAVVTGMAMDHGGSTMAMTDTLPMPTTGGTSAAYMTLTNRGAPDVLLGVATEAAEAAELHSMEMRDNVMLMRPVGQIELPANGQIQLRPGGLHLMLIGLRRELVAGERVKLTLTFQNAGAIEVEAPVRAP